MVVDSAEVVERDQAAAEAEAERGRRWAARRRSAVRAVVAEAEQDLRRRQLVPARAVVRDRMSVAEMSARGIDRRYSRDRGRIPEWVPDRGPRLCRALDPVVRKELDQERELEIVHQLESVKGLPIGRASRSRRLGCRVWERVRQVHGYRTRERAFKTARRTVRSRFKIGRAV